MSYLLKKITLKNVSDTFSDMQLKRVIGGYGDGCFYITCDDGNYSWYSSECSDVFCETPGSSCQDC